MPLRDYSNAALFILLLKKNYYPTVYSTSTKAGPALWGLATSTVQYQNGQYIETIDIVILVT